MKFWDSSALVPLFVAQAQTQRLRGLFAEDPDAVAWVLSDVEVHSALARLVRDGALSRERSGDALREFGRVWSTLHSVTLIAAVVQRAKRLLGMHTLSAADALQLAAALAATADQPADVDFVCCDERLADAARREGFRVVG